jgi:hypothetical protein
MTKAPDINRIIDARVIENCIVEFQFSDGYVGRVDLAPALWGPIFEPLKDPDYFRQLRIEDDTVRWPNDVDFCPDVLRYWCDAGGVQTQAVTDAHFDAQIRTPVAS